LLRDPPQPKRIELETIDELVLQKVNDFAIAKMLAMTVEQVRDAKADPELRKQRRDRMQQPASESGPPPNVTALWAFRGRHLQEQAVEADEQRIEQKRRARIQERSPRQESAEEEPATV
jgi:hypothetical protein